MAEYIIKINKDGTVDIDAQEFTDNTCLEQAADLLTSLGQVKSQELKPEARHDPQDITYQRRLKH